MGQDPVIEDMSQTTYSKHEETASIHTKTSEGNKHNLDVQDQQTLEAAHNRLFPRDAHEEKHSSHPIYE
jgi:hypothetical protein